MQKALVPILIVVILGIGILLFLVPKAPKKTGPGSVPIPRREVIVGKDGFSPQSQTIKKGETVMWINKSGETVTVNSDPHPTHNLHRFLNRGELPSDSSVQVTFEESGTYGYHNHLSPSQTGTIIVE